MQLRTMRWSFGIYAWDKSLFYWRSGYKKFVGNTVLYGFVQISRHDVFTVQSDKTLDDQLLCAKST